MAAQTSMSYRSPRRRARWAIALLVLVALVSAVAAASDLAERDLLQHLKDGERITLQELEASDDRQGLIATIYLGLYLLSAITFLFWFYLTYRNLYALGVEGLEYSPKWTWLGFVIPFMWFYRPCQVAAEIWRASGFREHHKTPYAWRGTDAGDIVYVWWGSFLVITIIDRFAMRAYDNADTLDQALRANFWSAIVNGCDVIGAGIAVLFVWALTQRQDRNTTAMENLAEPSMGSV